MLLKISMGLSAVVVAFLVYVALQPADYQVSREIVINAPAEKIFPHINSSKLSNVWMPWKDADPKVEMIFSGPEEGVGSTSSWTSEGKMGVGEAVIVESMVNERVKTQLNYKKPMNMSQMAEMSLTPQDGGTLVQWSVSGKNSFLGRIFCVFMNMDKMVGTSFEAGLARLKSIVEAT